MPNSNSRASKASRANNATSWNAQKRKQGLIKSYTVTLRDNESIQKFNNVKNKPHFLRNALKYLDENGELK